MKLSTYYIREYGVIKNAADFENAVSGPDELYLPSNAFTSLYNHILASQPPEGDIPFTLFSKAKKLQVKVRNYVGVLETKDGVSLEILPKIYTGDTINIDFTREVFLKMLKHVNHSPFISLNSAHLAVKKNFPVLEVFIRSYIEEVEKIFSSGIKTGYVLKEENVKFLKGKLLVSKNIKYNSKDHSKFFCEFSEMSENILPNKLIKTTLLKLLKTTSSYNNYALINKLLTHLEKVTPSVSIKKDLEAALKIKNRLFTSYSQVLQWSEVLLLNKGFTNFSGSAFNTAILFPMEKVFENYISFLFKKHSNANKIKTQDRSYFLVEKHVDGSRFRLRPDIYLEKNQAQRMIIDTKWKMINETKSGLNYNIRIGDMYQLFAYGKKYSDAGSVPSLAVIYPRNENFVKALPPFVYEDGLVLKIFPFNFEGDEKEEINRITSFREN